MKPNWCGRPTRAGLPRFVQPIACRRPVVRHGFSSALRLPAMGNCLCIRHAPRATPASRLPGFRESGQAADGIHQPVWVRRVARTRVSPSRSSVALARGVRRLGIATREERRQARAVCVAAIVDVRAPHPRALASQRPDQVRHRLVRPVLAKQPGGTEAARRPHLRQPTLSVAVGAATSRRM